ncbi:S1 RNA-binding domain-containing protein [Haploplasma modicum]|jgi:general stress protein 13|uniref:S1 RNA-binding domain-containing protein n=1 Tax=Haploplasma modicum TaxID=2150 RepID=UPI00214C63E9|nr:S1 RNA-binding domain-containing protein [Haploplasma modicum]MCR1809325.1 S1 RNA-binding domain-containing protein [Haploplasma modicum]
MKKNDLIECKITGFQEYGMFVNCGEYNGLVHISEISELFVADIENIFNINDIVRLQVIEVDEETKRYKLSYKSCHEINKKISKSIPIIIGFHTLRNKLPEWISKKKVEIDESSNNK